jgi:hippurate hydrolase
MKPRFVIAALLVLALAVPATMLGQQGGAFSVDQVNAIYPEVEALYIDLHRNPELAFQEKETAAKLAERMRALGYEVTTGVGGTGVVAVLKNGPGPTVMLRTDMDALPMAEKTGLPFASTVTTKNAAGAMVPVMHACGHDTHMSAWIGTAKLMAQNRQRWHGTLVMIGQPAEEIEQGAKAMLKDGLFTRFPKPDFVIGLHDTQLLPTGQIGFHSGYDMSASDRVAISIFGRGGHGARPHTTVDPIVIAARTILALQTLVSRENDPLEMAVVTVGSIHGGTVGNIIPDEVKLELTVRSFNPQVRKKLLTGIERIAKAEALAAAAPREPLVEVLFSGGAVYNNPELTTLAVATLRRALGAQNVVEVAPVTASEDFAAYGAAGVPALFLHFGAANAAKLAASQQSGIPLPGTHSPLWAPEPESIKTAIMAETAILLDLFGGK